MTPQTASQFSVLFVRLAMAERAFAAGDYVYAAMQLELARRDLAVISSAANLAAGIMAASTE